MQKPRRQLQLFLVISALGVPSLAHANPGAPLVAAGVFHLVFLNLAIGLGEGFLIALLFRARVRTAVGKMILANYFSTFVGLVLLLPLTALARLILGTATIYDLWMRIWIYIGALYVLAVLLEWPFSYSILRDSRPKGTRVLGISLLACAIAQAASYAVLVQFYQGASVYGVYSTLTVDRTMSFARGHPATIYFLRNDGVYKVHTNGAGLTKVADTAMMGFPTELSVEESPAGDRLQLWLFAEDARNMMLSGHFATIPHQLRSHEPYSWAPWTSGTFDLRPPLSSKWDVRATHFGASAQDRDAEKWVGVALQLPFFEWRGSSANVLPGDIVIAELSGQIIAFDPNSRKMGLVAMGRNPVATTGDERIIDNDIRKAVERILREKTVR